MQSIPLWPDAPAGSVDDFIPTLDLYPLAERPAETRGAVLVCPGGGYSGRAPHEGEPIAQKLNDAGIPAFVVQYRVAPNRHPAPIDDAMRAMRIIRSRAEEWNIDPEKIAILGFSAGGHLAGSVVVHGEDADSSASDPLMKLSGRANAGVLCYPVLSSGEFAHRGSFNNLLGTDASDEMLAFMSLEKQVDEKTPPCFLWSTSDDGAVPVQNSLLFAMGLRQHNIPFEMHVYPNGNHGLGLAEQADNPQIKSWMPHCIHWLKQMGW